MSKNDHYVMSTSVLFQWCIAVRLLCFSLTTAISDPKLAMPPVDILDNPIWVKSTGLLYMVCKLQSKIYSYDPKTGVYTNSIIEDIEQLDFVVPVQGQVNKFVAGAGSRVIMFDWDAQQDQTIKIIGNMNVSLGKDTVFTGKTDGKGRVWICSTQGSVYSVDAAGKITEHLRDLGKPQGMSFSVFGTKLYYVEITQGALMRHDYNLTTGELGLDRELVFDFAANNVTGDPDGVTIDSENNVWVACYASNHIVKIDPRNGTLSAKVHVSEASVTSLVFGGSNLDSLFVTTSNTYGGDNTGTLYRVTDPGTIGVLSEPFNATL